MSEQACIEEALRAADLPTAIRSQRDLSGGCIHQVRQFTLEDGRGVVAKLNSPNDLSLFEEEAAGLEALARTETVRVPEPLVAGVFGGRAVLLMTEMPMGSARKTRPKRLPSLTMSDSGRRLTGTTARRLSPSTSTSRPIMYLLSAPVTPASSASLMVAPWLLA